MSIKQNIKVSIKVSFATSMSCHFSEISGDTSSQGRKVQEQKATLQPNLKLNAHLSLPSWNANHIFKPYKTTDICVILKSIATPK